MMQRATLPALFLLAACGGGTGIPTTVSETVDAVGMPAGTLEGETSYSGIPFADGTETSDDFEGIAIPVKMVHWHRDSSTRAVTLQISEETVTLDTYFYRSSFGDAEITLNGATLDIDGYAATIGGRTYYHTGRRLGADTSVSNRHELYSAVDGGVDQFWDYATFVIGAETDPAWVAAQSGEATYDGRFFVAAFPAYNGGTPSDQYANFVGTLSVVMDFDANTASGSLSGYTGLFRQDEDSFDDNVTGRIAEAPILGNGFESALIFDDCGTFSFCNAGNSRLAGALYGDEGKALTGVILLDAEFSRGGQDAQLSGPGHFDANPATE